MDLQTDIKNFRATAINQHILDVIDKAAVTLLSSTLNIMLVMRYILKVLIIRIRAYHCTSIIYIQGDHRLVYYLELIPIYYVVFALVLLR